MSDPLDRLASTVMAIKSDDELKKSIIQVLKFGASTQQVRVAALKAKLEEAGAPAEVLEFADLLSNDKLAHAVLQALED